jgi:hypothetical protein
MEAMASTTFPYFRKYCKLRASSASRPFFFHMQNYTQWLGSLEKTGLEKISCKLSDRE